MSCLYQNIYDLCNNKYSYQYANVIFDGITCVADTGNSASVIRTDKDTGITDIITFYSTNNVDYCDASVETESIGAWECYQYYRSQDGIISDPLLETYKIEQKNHITTSYNNVLNNGIITSINNNTITLSGAQDKQIYYRNLVLICQMLYNDDVDSTMPLFTDYYNVGHKLNYIDISTIFQNYFRQIIYYKNLKDLLLIRINNAKNISDIQSCIWDTSLPIESDPSSSSIVNEKIISIPVCPNIPEPPTPTEECCVYRSVTGAYGLEWIWDSSCRPECTSFTCPDSGSVLPLPTVLNETTSRSCSV